LAYRLCLQLVRTGDIPSVLVGSRRRIDARWVEQWLASGGYRPEGRRCVTGLDPEHQVNLERLITAK
jgi:hypothetical protein